MMDMKPIKSTQIKAVGYDSSAKVMAVEFHNGGMYHYHAVTPDIHSDLLKAKSHGSYLSTHVKGAFKFVKVGAHKAKS